MSEPKLTPWFVNGEKPARKGVYQVDSLFSEFAWSRWDGKTWGWRRMRHATAAQDRNKTERKITQWRGLANQPKAKP